MSEDKDVLLQWNPEAINNCTPSKRVEIMDMFLGRIAYFYEQNKNLQSELTTTKEQLERAVGALKKSCNCEYEYTCIACSTLKELGIIRNE